MIQDPVNLNTISLAQAIQKSSCAAIAKLTLDLPKEAVFRCFSAGGIGEYVGTGLPGEAIGRFTNVGRTSRVSRVVMSYGYGFSVTAMQLASAYVTWPAMGIVLPLSILKRDRAPRSRARV